MVGGIGKESEGIGDGLNQNTLSACIKIPIRRESDLNMIFFALKGIC